MARDSEGLFPRGSLFSRPVPPGDAAYAPHDNPDARLRTGRHQERNLRWLFFAFAIFAGAYLLFQVEPLIGKFILPWFGGGPAVWTTCVLFFQVVLLAAYSYAHLSLYRLKPAHQGFVHVALLLLALLMLPITPAETWKPENSGDPALNILLLLLSSVGLPFFVLAATSPLLQAWFVRICPDRSPYPLYALSNLASLFALLSYPFFFEPYFKLSQQTDGWSGAFRLFVLACGWLAFEYRSMALNGSIAATPEVDGGAKLSDAVPSSLRWFLWLALPTATSALLLAVTNQLCQDTASVPFLWVVPLSLYLLSFILCFARRNWYSRRLFIPALIAGAFGLVTVLYEGSTIDLEWQIGVYGAGLFFCCMSCHGELYRLRPHPERLTTYYLAIAAGGAVGGVFVGVFAPLVFPLYFEFHIGLFACCALILLALAQDMEAFRHKRHKTVIRLLSLLALAFLAGRLANQAYQTASAKTVVTRNFYGVLRVEERSADNPELRRRVLRHGAIDHGFQFLAPQKRHLPTAYYGPTSGIGLAIDHSFPTSNRRIGLVGLGTGTLLAYGKPGDHFRIYEINPTVVRLAQEYFTYLADSPAARNIVVGDARLSLEREAPQAFDLLILDAFSGGAIPIHLLTAEALALYTRHLSPDGVLVINISNHYLDLKPLARGLAEGVGYQYLIVHSEPSPDGVSFYGADWAILTRNQAFLKQPAIEAALAQQLTPAASLVWTDDFSNLFRVLKR